MQEFHACEMTSFLFTVRKKTGYLVSSFEIGANIFPVGEVLYLPRFTDHFGEHVIGLEKGASSNPPGSLFQSFHTADGSFIMTDANYLSIMEANGELEHTWSRTSIMDSGSEMSSPL